MKLARLDLPSGGLLECALQLLIGLHAYTVQGISILKALRVIRFPQSK